MSHLKIYLISITVIVLLFSCNLSKNNTQGEGACQTKFVNGSTNNKLEILDFGGTGQPILFLTGLGNSAHVFVDFAPKFTDKFHVYAMSRRGYGASEQTANGYHTDTLANDVLAVTKTLELNKVILIGHSVAGQEISKFASSYPDRVDKVIYLDAAFDMISLTTILSHTPFPAPPIPTAKDSLSFLNYKEYVTRISVSMPDEELKTITVFSKDGRYQKDATSGLTDRLVRNGVEHPNYKNMSCPALAIYVTHNSVKEVFPYYDSLDAENKKGADAFYTSFSDWNTGQIEIFKKEVKNGIVKEIRGAHHHVFLSNPDETEKAIWEFLK